MARARTGSSGSILFPWESRVGFRRFFRLGRVRSLVLVLAGITFFVVIGARERRQAGIRETRATLLVTRRAVDAYMAENEGACPPNLEKVLDYGNFKVVPTDGWGNPLRLVCPARREGERYELMSDGPDGKPGGLDRIE